MSIIPIKKSNHVTPLSKHIKWLPISFRESKSRRSRLQVTHGVYTHLASVFSIIPAASAHWSAYSFSNLPGTLLPQGPVHCLCLEHPDVHIALVYFPSLCKCDLLKEASFPSLPYWKLQPCPEALYLFPCFTSLHCTYHHILHCCHNLFCLLLHTPSIMSTAWGQVDLFCSHSITNAKNIAWNIVLNAYFLN